MLVSGFPSLSRCDGICYMIFMAFQLSRCANSEFVFSFLQSSVPLARLAPLASLAWVKRGKLGKWGK